MKCSSRYLIFPANYKSTLQSARYVHRGWQQKKPFVRGTGQAGPTHEGLMVRPSSGRWLRHDGYPHFFAFNLGSGQPLGYFLRLLARHGHVAVVIEHLNVPDLIPSHAAHVHEGSD